MELPKHVCEKCYENGTVREAKIRVIQHEKHEWDFSETVRIKELCINHFYELSIIDIVGTVYQPYYETKDLKLQNRKFRNIPDSSWKKTIIEYV